MIQKSTGIVLAALGLLLVMVLIFLRIDVHLAAKLGPKWKRKLVMAGIFGLSILGVTIPNVSCTSDNDTTQTTGQGGTTTGSEGGSTESSHLEKTWKEADEIASA